MKNARFINPPAQLIHCGEGTCAWEKGKFCSYLRVGLDDSAKCLAFNSSVFEIREGTFKGCLGRCQACFDWEANQKES